MKPLLLVALTIMITSLVGVTKVSAADINNLQAFPIGSLTIVSNYCIAKAKNFNVFISQLGFGGVVNRGATGPFPSKEVLDIVLQDRMNTAINDMIANNYGQDNSKPFRVIAICTDTIDSDTYFQSFQDFSLVRNGGVYTIPPELSTFKTEFAKRIPYKLRGVTWAHLETTNLLTGVVRIDDSYKGSTNIQTTAAAGIFRLLIPLEEAIGAGSTYGIRASVYNTNQFEVYQDGLKVSEKLPAMKVRSLMAPGLPKIVLEMVGGEIGRVYSMVASTSLNGSYTDTGSRHRVTPTSDYTTITLDVSSEGNRFFILKSLQVAPLY